MFVRTQKILRLLITAVTLFFSTIFLLTAYFYFGFHSDAKIENPRLAFWMEHAWSSDARDFELLHQRVEDLNITDLYFHVGPLSEDGSLADDLNYISSFQNLDTTNYAWIGQLRSEIDLDSPDVRARIVESSKWIVERGFDGIHLNIEPVRHDDTGYFELLKELRAALPEAKLSIATDEWQPHFISLFLANILNTTIQSYWQADQITNAAEYVDQIVVMTYDTGFKDPDLFSWWVEQQTISLSSILPKDIELFVGIPSYDKGSNIHPEAENIETGLKGFEKGVQNYRSDPDKITGIAIYSYWTMDDAEWDSLKNL